MSSSVSINKSFIHHAPPPTLCFIMRRGCAHVAFCWLGPKFRFSNLSFVYSRLALAAFDFYFFQSHITHHCFCTLHLYITVVKPQLSLVRTRRAHAKRGRKHAGSSTSANGMRCKSHSVLSLRVCLWLQVLSFYLPTFHVERVCVILCIRSQRCTSWWRL